VLAFNRDRCCHLALCLQLILLNLPPCTNYFRSTSFENASILYFLTTQATLMRRSTVLGFPLQLGFPGTGYRFTCDCIAGRQNIRGDRRLFWLSWPFQKRGWPCCKPHSTRWFQTIWKRQKRVKLDRFKAVKRMVWLIKRVYVRFTSVTCIIKLLRSS